MVKSLIRRIIEAFTEEEWKSPDPWGFLLPSGEFIPVSDAEYASHMHFFLEWYGENIVRTGKNRAEFDSIIQDLPTPAEYTQSEWSKRFPPEDYPYFINAKQELRLDDLWNGMRWIRLAGMAGFSSPVDLREGELQAIQRTYRSIEPLTKENRNRSFDIELYHPNGRAVARTLTYQDFMLASKVSELRRRGRSVTGEGRREAYCAYQS